MTTPEQLADQSAAIEQVERVRNRIAIFLVGAFVGALVIFTFKAIPEESKDIITYMVGQLSGMATMVLGFYFVNKIGQDAADAKRADNTGKLADAITTVAQNTGAGTADPGTIHAGDKVEINKPDSAAPPDERQPAGFRVPPQEPKQ